MLGTIFNQSTRKKILIPTSRATMADQKPTSEQEYVLADKVEAATPAVVTVDGTLPAKRGHKCK